MKGASGSTSEKALIALANIPKYFTLFENISWNAKAVGKPTNLAPVKVTFTGQNGRNDRLSANFRQIVLGKAALFHEITKHVSIPSDRHAATGRAPYAPRAMLGLILYGIMHGVSSLRALERLARVDLGCMWVTGGITPDHANIRRFICLHEQTLVHGFFRSANAHRPGQDNHVNFMSGWRRYRD